VSARWRTIGLALGAGAAAALAHPPFGFLIGLLGFGLLMHLLDGPDPVSPLKSAFWRGWLAGGAYFLVSTWWVGEAFLVDVEAHGWQAPFAIGFLAGGLGLLWGAAGVVYTALRPPGVWRVLTFAAVFALIEWLRGHILTGFPWDLPGEVWRAGGLVSQSASLMGVYALSFVTLAVSAAPAVWFGPDTKRDRFAATGAAVIALAALTGFGALRLAEPHRPDTGVRVRVVQADVEQSAKWSPEAFRDIYMRYIGLTATAAAGPRPEVVIWPESAIPADSAAYLAEGSWTRAALTQALKPGQVLIMGAVRTDGSGPDAHYFNAVLALRRDPGGLTPLARYDKHHLVPFGEYMPMDGLMGAVGFKALVHVGDGFTAGPPPAPMRLAALPPVQPLICYESLFPALMADAGARPGWIVNVSNDAWFGQTSGPWQHLNLASYRAIEQGLPMVRDTPTGVSAVIDAYGRPVRLLGPGKRGVIDADLPAAAPPTLYRSLGEAPFWLMVVSGIAVGAPSAYRRLKLRTRGQQL
jgi:apolipoprotein N-acyltransferase